MHGNIPKPRRKCEGRQGLWVTLDLPQASWAQMWRETRFLARFRSPQVNLLFQARIRTKTRVVTSKRLAPALQALQKTISGNKDKFWLSIEHCFHRRNSRWRQASWLPSHLQASFPPLPERKSLTRQELWPPEGRKSLTGQELWPSKGRKSISRQSCWLPKDLRWVYYHSFWCKSKPRQHPWLSHDLTSPVYHFLNAWLRQDTHFDSLNTCVCLQEPTDLEIGAMLLRKRVHL